MQLNSVVKINSLHWVMSFPEDQTGVSRRVLEDLESLCAAEEFPLSIYTPSTASEFIAVLDEIAAKTRLGTLPMIHLDAHGSADQGLIMGVAGEHVGWSTVAEKLRAVNAAAGNNLCVMMSVCFGFHLVSQIDINAVSPFYILLAPQDKITFGEVEDSTRNFYERMLEGGDILEAKELCFPYLEVFHCERMLAVVLARYINNSAMGKQKERRKEDLISKAIAEGVPRNRQNLRLMRKTADRLITPTEDLLKRFLPVFLAGKKPAFTISQLKEMVRSARVKGIKAQGPYAD